MSEEIDLVHIGWIILVGMILIAMLLGFYYGIMAITHHFYPEDGAITTIQTINSQESHSKECYLNGAKINCSEMT
jgi:hypothetical protein